MWNFKKIIVKKKNLKPKKFFYDFDFSLYWFWSLVVPSPSLLFIIDLLTVVFREKYSTSLDFLLRVHGLRFNEFKNTRLFCTSWPGSLLLIHNTFPLYHLVLNRKKLWRSVNNVCEQFKRNKILSHLNFAWNLLQNTTLRVVSWDFKIKHKIYNKHLLL